MEKYGYDNVFRITDYTHPFDNYKNQEVVIFADKKDLWWFKDSS